MNRQVRIVKQLRLKAGITQTKLAKAIGVTQGLIAQIEKGDVNLTDGMILKLAAFYDVPREEISLEAPMEMNEAQLENLFAMIRSLPFPDKLLVQSLVRRLL